jgi:hypothetical protein
MRHPTYKPCTCGLCEQERKRLARREAKRAFMAQNPLWQAEYEAWIDRVRDRRRKKTKRYLRGLTQDAVPVAQRAGA